VCCCVGDSCQLCQGLGTSFRFEPCPRFGRAMNMPAQRTSTGPEIRLTRESNIQCDACAGINDTARYCLGSKLC
jgi:hypothetical protein